MAFASHSSNSQVRAQGCRIISLAHGVNRHPHTHPLAGDVTILAADTWHGGLPQHTDAHVLFGHMDRVRDISRGNVGFVEGDDPLPDAHSVAVVTTLNRAAFVSTIQRLWRVIE